MNTLYWFNPENDLALAADQRNYTPPRAALQLRAAGELLPSLWTDPTDTILRVDSPDRQQASEAIIDRVEPWGWSEYTANALARHGVEPMLLPSTARLHLMRRLSHRAIATHILHRLGYDSRLIPIIATDTDTALRAVDGFGGDAVVKLPWSSSGRGVMWTSRMNTRMLRSTLSGMIRHQGSVTIEPSYDRLRDFAMLFHRSDGVTRYRGISLFDTDNAGRYTGNIIAPQSELVCAAPAAIETLRAPLCAALDAVADGYEGWIGVDMLTYRTPGGSEAIAPCIEVNLRMTMGIAALMASEAGKLPWDRATLRVAMPGEIPGGDSIPMSGVSHSMTQPLTAPCIIVQKRRNIV